MLSRWILGSMLQPILSAALKPLLNVLLRNSYDLQEIKRMSGNLATEIQNLTDSVRNLTTVDASVTALIEGFDDRMQAAVEKALQAGASEEMLASIRAATAAISGEARTLGQAVVANTPSAPTAPAPAPVESDPATSEDPAAPVADPAAGTTATDPAAPTGAAPTA